MAGLEPELMAILPPLLVVLASMIEELARLTKQVLDIVKTEATCRLMTSPGIGPVNAPPSTDQNDSNDRATSARISV